MKNLIMTIVITFLIFSSNAYAEKYVGTEPPSDSLIAFNLTPKGMDLERLVGKFKHTDNRFTVYYYEREFSAVVIKQSELIMLDSKIWIIDFTKKGRGPMKERGKKIVEIPKS